MSSTSCPRQSEGVGIRVIHEGRTGFAYAGTLDESAIAEVLAEARDNVQFGTVDEWAGLAEPDGVEVTAQTLWNDELAEFPTDRKIDLAKELEKLASGSDPRVRVDDSNYADAHGESAVAIDGRDPHVGSRERVLRRRCRRSPTRARATTPRRRPGSGSPSVGRPTSSISTVPRARRSIGRRACSARRNRRVAGVTVVLDPFVTAQFIGVISSTLNGEAVVKGRSLFRDRIGEEVAAAGRHAGRRPDESAGLHRHRCRR